MVSIGCDINTWVQTKVYIITILAYSLLNITAITYISVLEGDCEPIIMNGLVLLQK
jgi:hypothetical protein